MAGSEMPEPNRLGLYGVLGVWDAGRQAFGGFGLTYHLAYWFPSPLVPSMACFRCPHDR